MSDITESVGYKKLLAAVEHDEAKASGTHDYRGKLSWVLARAQHYAEKTGLPPAAILDAWEAERRYWYMNYYQDCNQPLLESDKVRVFDTLADLHLSLGDSGFRCPSCSGVSKSPYECDAGTKRSDGKVCDWKAYGLFRTAGKGAHIFVKERVAGEEIFFPIAWETEAVAEGASA